MKEETNEKLRKDPNLSQSNKQELKMGNALFIQDSYDGTGAKTVEKPSRFKKPVGWREKLPKHLVKSLSVLAISKEESPRWISPNMIQQKRLAESYK